MHNKTMEDPGSLNDFIEYSHLASWPTELYHERELHSYIIHTYCTFGSHKVDLYEHL